MLQMYLIYVSYANSGISFIKVFLYYDHMVEITIQFHR